VQQSPGAAAHLEEEIGMAVDTDKLMEFVGSVIGDLGATLSAGGVVIGHRLGLYTALAQGPATPEQLAERTGCHPRYLTEWLRSQAAGGYVGYQPETGTFAMSEEQAFALTDPAGPIYLPGAFLLALASLRSEPRITEAFRTGQGMGWHEHDEDVFTGCELFFRPGYLANLTTSWIPALDGVEAKLAAGATVADIGCGLGSSSLLMAQAYPRASVVGSDYHDLSIEQARKAAGEAGVGDRVQFEVASAQTFAGSGFDLVTSFDCLHDMGDPLGAARHVRAALAPDGTWMVVEPAAGDRVEDNLNPVGRVYYSASTLLCVPNGLSQPGGYALGAQAGEAAIRQLVTDAGFTRFRRAAETPFNIVYEVRP
jgi:2-polyprenyl-3-methyl-5-hydroxy-6-metoxy-1,4-benzoquinol methylase